MHYGFSSRQWALMTGVPAGKFVHERGILCAKLVVAGKFVHERGVLCAKLELAGKFVHERGILCAKWAAGIAGPAETATKKDRISGP